MTCDISGARLNKNDQPAGVMIREPLGVFLVIGLIWLRFCRLILPPPASRSVSVLPYSNGTVRGPRVEMPWRRCTRLSAWVDLVPSRALAMDCTARLVSSSSPSSYSDRLVIPSSVL